MPINSYKLELMPLPYSYDALEPYIDEQTVEVHHDRLLKAYVDRMNATYEKYPYLQRFTIEQLLMNPRLIPAPARTPVINFGGGVYNHNFFFNALRPGTPDNMPTGALAAALVRRFGSFDGFKSAFKENALSVFGSGYLWLVKDRRGNLLLVKTANQDSPISMGYLPLITIDVWEHAYFLQYLNLRSDYIDGFFHVVNWDFAEAMFREERQ